MRRDDNASYKRLIAIDWCKKLIEDSRYRTALLLPPPSSTTQAGVFIGKTLRTEDAIRSGLCLYQVEGSRVTNLIVLYEIGSGLNGHPEAAHGGLVATLLDESCGLLLGGLFGSNVQKLLDVDGRRKSTFIFPKDGAATIYLNVTYQAFVKTPSVIAIRVWLKERSGRKIYVNAQMEDSSGKKLAKVESMFLLQKQASL